MAEEAKAKNKKLIDTIFAFQNKFTKILNRVSRCDEEWMAEDLDALEIVEGQVIERMRKTTIEVLKPNNLDLPKTRSAVPKEN